MASITKRGKVYRVLWREQSGAQRSRTCPDLTTARELQREVERALALGRDWQVQPPREDTRLSVVVEAFLRDKARSKRPATVINLGRALDRFFVFLEERGIHEPTVDVLSRAILGEFYDWSPASVATRRNYVSAVTLAWRWAFNTDEYGDVTPRPRTLDLPVPASTPTVAPTWAEADALIARLAERPSQGLPSVIGYRAAVMMRFTGLRVGQVLRLEWPDVDLEDATLTIRGELGKSRAERRGRTVPISSHLVELMKGWGVREGPIISSAGCISSLGELLRIGWRDVAANGQARPEVFRGRPNHALRKLFSTELRAAGVARDVIEYLVGHSAGLPAVYTDARAISTEMRAAVALIPPITAAPSNIVALRRRARHGQVLPPRCQGDEASGPSARKLTLQAE